MKLSEDSFSLVLVCSHLDLPEENPARPLSARELTQLESRLAARSLTLDHLAGSSAEKLQSLLQCDKDQASRLAGLLDRDRAVRAEIDRLGDLGIWVITRVDKEYPLRFNERLGSSAPPLLYGAGNRRLLNRRGIAVVGSRDIDDRDYELSESIGNACAESKLVVFSGGARGVDKTAMGASIAAGGCAAGLLADSLEKGIRAPDARRALEADQLVLATSFSPTASFTAGIAMARNKLIYALSDFALVVTSNAEKGGTWKGAEEALKAGWLPVFVVDGPNVSDGNRLLIKHGGIPFPESFDESPASLGDWLEEHTPEKKPTALQGSLF